MQVLIHSLNLQKEILFFIYVGNWFHICGPRAATLLLPKLVVVLRADPLSANPSKWSNILKQFVCSSVFDHFLGLALTRLTIVSNGFSFKKCFVDFALKEPQTISIYSFYLLCNHVATSTKSKLFVHKLQFISNKLCPSSTPHDQLCELAFLFSHSGSHFLKRHTRVCVKLVIWFKL